MDEILKYRADKMRRNPTRAERFMWQLLRNRKLNRFKFRRQYLIEPYIVDFVCLHKKIIIELDGYTHDSQILYDIKGTKYLNQNGYRVIRIANIKLLSHPDEVLERIIKIMQNEK